jgi:hypothetical protein
MIARKRTSRIELLEQEIQEQIIQKRTARTELQEQDSKNRTART